MMQKGYLMYWTSRMDGRAQDRFTTPAAEQLSKSIHLASTERWDILLHPHGSLPYFGQADTHRERRSRRRRIVWRQAVAKESSRFRVLGRQYADEMGDG